MTLNKSTDLPISDASGIKESANSILSLVFTNELDARLEIDRLNLDPDFLPAVEIADFSSKFFDSATEQRGILHKKHNRIYLIFHIIRLQIKIMDSRATLFILFS